MCIVDGDGVEVFIGEIGELIVKSVVNMCCYLNQFEVIVDIVCDGWLYIGDLVCIDEEGLIYIVDCKKSIIICGGENIVCLEVEGVLYCYLDVVEVGVFLIFDECLGEIVGVGVQFKFDVCVDEVGLKVFFVDYLVFFKIFDCFWLCSELLFRGGIDKIDCCVLCV